MKPLLNLLVAAFFVMISGALSAQTEGKYWLQVEAKPDLESAASRAQSYQDIMRDVSIFQLKSGWYAIAIGPFRRPTANSLLRQLRASRQIPRDSFIAQNDSFKQRLWSSNPQAVSETLDAVSEVERAEASNAAEEASDTQSLRDARRAERALNTQQRKELQSALSWSEFYQGAIDGKFGPATRTAMAAWQNQNGAKITGVLTTRQRQRVTEEFRAPLEGLNFKLFRGEKAGIAIDYPSSVMQFQRYEAPFVHFTPSAKTAAWLVLISQKGDRAALASLYNLMQKLDIVPLEGARKLERRKFEITGRNAHVISHTEAALVDGEIKGFSLIWPTGDETRRRRVLAHMQASFGRLSGTLGDAEGHDNIALASDMIGGLSVRKPKQILSGVFIAEDATVLTISADLQSCQSLTIERSYDVDVVARDEATGLTLLRPKDALAPLGLGQIIAASDVPLVDASVVLAGYRYGGELPAPTIRFGKIAALRGLQGDPTMLRVLAETGASDQGGPVLDAAGRLIGVIAPKMANVALPSSQTMAANASGIRAFLTENGMSNAVASSLPSSRSEPALALHAGQITPLIECWG